jgi:hypothetical protein
MNLPRDPNEMDDPRRADPLLQDPLETNRTAERNEIRRAENSLGMVPALSGLVLLVVLGAMVFVGSNRTSMSSQTTATDVQKPVTTPKTAPTQPQ